LYKNPVLRASGWICYVYASRGGPLIFKSPPCASKAEALKAAEANAVDVSKRYAEERHPRDQGTFARVISDYRRSPEFKTLSASTRSEYHRWLDAMETILGALTGDQMAKKHGAQAARLWRDGLAKKSPRNADYAMTVLAAVCTWGRGAYMLGETAIPTRHIAKLYTAPEQTTWSDDDLNRAVTALPPHLTHAIKLALNTGLRRGDLTAVTWSAIDEAAGVIRWRPSKGRRKGRIVVIPLTAALRLTLAAIPKVAVQILTNSRGKPWTVSGLGHAMDDALEPLGIEGRLHGLRRAAATRLARQGFSSRQIARQLGWSEAEAEAMTAVYVDDEAALAAAGANE